MTDITKCVGGCDKQSTCYRWTAQASGYQSYSDFKPNENGDCEDYWDNTGKNGWSKR